MFDPKIEISCNACKVRFFPKSEKNIYCTRKCFKKYFYHKKKAEELANIKYPCFKCPSCQQLINLDFDPTKYTDRWDKYVCPGCNTLMINVSEEIYAQDMSI